MREGINSALFPEERIQLVPEEAFAKRVEGLQASDSFGIDGCIQLPRSIGQVYLGEVWCANVESCSKCKAVKLYFKKVVGKKWCQQIGWMSSHVQLCVQHSPSSGFMRLPLLDKVTIRIHLSGIQCASTWFALNQNWLLKWAGGFNADNLLLCESKQLILPSGFFSGNESRSAI